MLYVGSLKALRLICLASPWLFEPMARSGSPRARAVCIFSGSQNSLPAANGPSSAVWLNPITVINAALPEFFRQY